MLEVSVESFEFVWQATSSQPLASVSITLASIPNGKLLEGTKASPSRASKLSCYMPLRNNFYGINNGCNSLISGYVTHTVWIMHAGYKHSYVRFADSLNAMF